MTENFENRNSPPPNTISRRGFLSNGLISISTALAVASVWQSSETGKINETISQLENQAYFYQRNENQQLLNATKSAILQRKSDQKRSHNRASGLLLGSIFATLQAHIIDYLPKTIQKK